MSSMVSIWSKPPDCAEAGVRRHVDGELLRPGLVERQPEERLAERAVQVDERRPVAAVHEDRRPAGDVDRLRLAALARQQHAGGVASVSSAPRTCYLLAGSGGRFFGLCKWGSTSPHHGRADRSLRRHLSSCCGSWCAIDRRESRSRRSRRIFRVTEDVLRARIEEAQAVAHHVDVRSIWQARPHSRFARMMTSSWVLATRVGGVMPARS